MKRVYWGCDSDQDSVTSTLCIQQKHVCSSIVVRCTAQVELPLLLDRFEAWEDEKPAAAAAAAPAKPPTIGKAQPGKRATSASASRVTARRINGDTLDGDGDSHSDSDHGDDDVDNAHHTKDGGENAAAGGEENEFDAALRHRVAALQASIAAEGGATGHWEARDHAQFMQVRVGMDRG